MSFVHTERETRLRVLAQDASDLHLSGTACFIGEKLMVTTNSVDNIYEVASIYYKQKQYERALWILNKRQAINKSVKVRYLAALCSLALDHANDVLAYVGETNPFSEKAARGDISLREVEGSIKLESAMCYLRGKAYIILKDVNRAIASFKEALTVDVKCYDALEALVTCSLMGDKEEWEFIMSLPFDDQCGPDAEYFRYLYSLKLTKSIHSERIMEPEANDLTQSLDVQFNEAERHFSEGSFEICLGLCKKIQEQDPYYKDSIYVYLSCLFELDQKMQLYTFAQRSVNEFKNEATTWHAVGLYYLYIKKNTEAKRYFIQAINMKKFAKYSWLGYAHAFSAEKEHDQAIDAYKICLETMPGFYMPLMYIAMEHMELGNMGLAREYFLKALEKNNTDPYLYNEFAIYCCRNKLFVEAQCHLHNALRVAREREYKKTVLWDKIWSNLGHIYRQEPLRNVDRAMQCFQNSLSYNYRNSDSLASIGMLQQMKGYTAKAVESYIKALRYTDHTEVIQELLDISLTINASIYTEDCPMLDTGRSLFSLESELKEKDIVEDELNWGIEN
ncbi:hypothetical protein G6F56_000148 [Rhizopus delemar]|uniref:Anaphase promoting complex subunit cdc16 n=1 Tax=Rhizopus stolonifer TaxID=4846 RepID=A0A367K9A3_RHIST|nr:hypothetical protein G6F56_000148 [Rhizopus delemar]RCH98765.1 anaphase promoting complex subunit cdc16 [Rhizopus stolonifer]